MQVRTNKAAALTAGAMLAGSALLSVGFRAASNPAPTRVLVVNGDTVSANEGCIVTGQYPRGTMIVFRAEVRTEAGRLAPPADKVVVHLSNGKTLPMMDIPHPFPGKPMYWVATWVIPMNAKLGTLTYTITATNPKNGVQGVFHPFPTPNSLPTVVPFTYTPEVSATVGGKAAGSVQAGTTVNVSAAVDLTVPKGKKTLEIPLTHGVVQAKLGIAGATNSKGALEAMALVDLHFDGATKSWVGALRVPPKTAAGAYEIEVTGHDPYGNGIASTPVYLAVQG